MVNQKNKYLATQIVTQGPTSGQQRIARQVQQYDELMRKPQPLAKKDAARVRKSPPTKNERRISRACQHQEKLVRKEIRQINRGNIEALLDATKSSRPQAALTEVEPDYLFQFCGNIIPLQSEDKAIQAAVEASVAPFNPYHRVLFTSGACGKAKGSKQPDTIAAATRTRSAGAAVVYKIAPGTKNENSNIWEEKLFRVSLPPSNTTTQNIEASLGSIAEALALVAIQLAHAIDDGVPHINTPLTRSKVTIFTDCRAVMARISKISLTARQLASTPSVKKLITRSEYLRHLGVEVELRCSPRLQSEGSKRAKRASRRTAKSPGACKSVDSIDEGLQILIDSLEQE